jgi:hypothetical protein
MIYCVAGLVGLCAGAGTGVLLHYARVTALSGRDTTKDLLVAVGAVFLLISDSARALGDLPGVIGQFLAYGTGVVFGAAAGVLAKSLANNIRATSGRHECREQH